MSSPLPLPDLSRLRELGDELLGELSSLIPNLTERTRGHASLVGAIAKKLDCGDTISSVLGLLGLGQQPVTSIEPEPATTTETVASTEPSTTTTSAQQAPVGKASARKAPASKAPATKTAAKTAAKKRAPVRHAPVEQVPTTRDLAIPGYDSLAASQVVPRLESLSPVDLEALRLHELGGRGRRTILTRIAQIQGR